MIVGMQAAAKLKADSQSRKAKVCSLSPRAVAEAVVALAILDDGMLISCDCSLRTRTSSCWSQLTLKYRRD